MVNKVEVLIIEVQWPPIVDKTFPNTLFFQQLLEDKLLKKCKYVVFRAIGDFGELHINFMVEMFLPDFIHYKGKSCKHRVS